MCKKKGGLMIRVYKLILVLLLLLLLSTVVVETSAFAMQEINWSTQASSMRGRNGQRVSYFCPPGGAIGNLWGSGLYTDDSSICTAAVHAGLINTYNGGDFTIEIRPGAGSYQGSRRNGVSSKGYGGFQGSFVFVTGGERQSGNVMMDDHNRMGDHRGRPAPLAAPGMPVPFPGALGNLGIPPNEDGGHQQQATNSIQIDWGTTVGSHRGRNGHRLRYYCPPGGALGSLWGSGLYTDDSSVCTAAVHAGLITTYKGGEFQVEIRPGSHSYQGSRKNGVNSQNYGSFDGSFIFVR